MFIPKHIIRQKQSSIKYLKQACSFFHRIIPFTKTSDITFLSQLNHWSKEREQERKGSINEFEKQKFSLTVHCALNTLLLPLQQSFTGTRSESCLNPCRPHPSQRCLRLESTCLHSTIEQRCSKKTRKRTSLITVEK